MSNTKIAELLRNGEGLSVEFKRCSGRIEHDVFETVCAFLNRFGGDVLLGVVDDGAVVGIGGDAVALRNNIMNAANDERVFDPVVYLDQNNTRDGRRHPWMDMDDDQMLRRLTPDNLQPSPRNPIVASFFREIAYADQLGSGVRNLFKYAKAYGGADPTIMDGDVFRISVSLKRTEVAPIGAEVAPIGAEVAPIGAEVDQRLRIAEARLKGRARGDGVDNAIKVLHALMMNCKMAIPDIERGTGLSNGSVKNAIRLLRLNGIIRHDGKSRGGMWVVLI